MYGYKPNFSKSVILSISDSVPNEGKDLLEDIWVKKDDQEVELDSIAYSVVIKLTPT